MDRILKILKKENGPRASSAPALELNTIVFKHVYWYMQLISGERLQDHWSSGYSFQSVTTKEDGVTHQTRVEFVKYGTAHKKDKSGAYLFLPDGPAKVDNPL